MSHHFLFQPGLWLGKGTISFSISPDTIPFTTRWTISQKRGDLLAVQEVEMSEIEEKVVNQYLLTVPEGDRFTVQLNNELFGQVLGKGLCTEEQLAWEFVEEADFQGFEVYQKSAEGYTFHAEFSSASNHRTIVKGKVWRA